MVRRIGPLFGLALLLIAPGILFGELTKVVSIGSKDLNELFFNVAGAVLGDQGAVFVLDSKGFFLRKYDARGRFIKEIGRHGQGPGDFSNVLSGFCLDRDLYVLDSGNARIVVIDQDLELKSSWRIERQGRRLDKIGRSFYMISSKPGGPFPEIVICDDRASFKAAFFDTRPAFMGGAPPTGMDLAMWKMYAEVVMAADRDAGEVAVAFKYPGPACDVFLYDRAGRFQKQIVIEHPVRYDFPGFRLRWPVSFPNKSTLISLGSAHYAGPHKLLLEYWLESYDSSRAVEQQKHLLVVDTETGRVVHRERLDPSIELMDAKGDLVCVRQDDDDSTRVVVYRLTYGLPEEPEVRPMGPDADTLRCPCPGA